jgi:hypothetical protein
MIDDHHAGTHTGLIEDRTRSATPGRSPSQPVAAQHRQVPGPTRTALPTAAQPRPTDHQNTSPPALDTLQRNLSRRSRRSPMRAARKLPRSDRLALPLHDPRYRSPVAGARVLLGRLTAAAAVQVCSCSPAREATGRPQPGRTSKRKAAAVFCAVAASGCLRGSRTTRPYAVRMCCEREAAIVGGLRERRAITDESRASSIR